MGSRESTRPTKRAAAYETAMAVWEAWYGNAAAARRGAVQVLDSEGGRHVTYAAALASALAGDTARAKTIAGDLERRFPEDTSVRFNYLPTLRALAALKTNDPARAIEVLQPAATYEFAQPGISFYGVGGVAFGAMYPTYVRGLAYLALRKPADAAAEFQKILEHPGVVLEDPMGALARLQLARAWSMAGDVGRAKRAHGGTASGVEGRRSRHSGSQRSTGGIRQVGSLTCPLARASADARTPRRPVNRWGLKRPTIGCSYC
jgi:hypothetical protein